MKQYINDKQFKSLTFEQLLKFIKLSKCNLISIPQNKIEWDNKRSKERYLTEYISLIQYFNIGKMIDIISIYESDYKIEHIEGEYCLTINYGMGGLEILRKCLCDALFEALCYVLKER